MKGRSMRKLSLAPLLALLALMGCETMQGAGRDLQTAGQLMTEQGAAAQTQMNNQPYN
ncbi:hypothetical protein JCM7686_2775 [Paracoccus aminophilus JCM 7686]|uniref:Entericidin EcnAB n=2 Tax=Paracoccus aminophilus TaxID=34003 RepID=S5YX83_PARAH|nr:hypothetical protein JCM7686_2775 [Paracoccus aminophilus JCM 7686]